jgi:hypothetical protein
MLKKQSAHSLKVTRRPILLRLCTIPYFRRLPTPTMSDDQYLGFKLISQVTVKHEPPRRLR